MDPLRWQRLERLYAAAEALPEPARAAYLDEAFGAAPDAALRAELETMLRAGAGSDTSGALAAALADGFDALDEDEAPPERLGPYRLLREIGRGGMATVYEAERDDREFERKVAIKLIRRGMDSAEIVRRLRRERQILANLDHPGIARLLDGGTTGGGRPYVVMELIEGEPIDLYCRRRGLGLDARLALFRQVCAAVGFAHKSLVLHRDIKPSNILVTAEGMPKLLDFGIAKVFAGRDRDEAPEPTRTGQRFLTPEWASPEQVRGEPLTTASDVYSLGLLLYLLVAGRRAYAVDSQRPAELERIVCEVEPPPPREAGAAGEGSAGRLWRRLFPADDLAVVTMNALRKEPSRRYASAEQLAEDVRRCREDLPIVARPDTLGYRAGVFVRRHRWAVLFAAAAVAALAATALVALLQAREAREQWLRAERNLELAEKQRRQAEDERRRAEQVADLLTGIFEVSDPGEARGRSLTAREVLDQGASRLRGSLADDPDLRAELLGTIGRIYQKLALYDDAEELLEEAAALRRAATPVDPADTPKLAASLRDLSQLSLERGRFEKALSQAGEALAILERGRPAPLEIAESLRQVADAEIQLDRLDSAEKRYREALAIEERLAGASSLTLAATRNGLGELQYRRGAFEPARRLFEQALAARRERLGADHPEIAVTLNNLAAAELALGRLPEAEQHLRQVLELRRKLFGENHDQVAGALNNLAAALAARGETRAAIDNAENALSIYRQVLGAEHPRVADGLHNLGQLRHQAGDLAAAAALYREALALRRKIHGPAHPAVAQTLRNLAGVVLDRDPARAESLFREALEIDRRALPAGDYRLAHSLFGLGRAALLRRDPAAAERAFAEAAEIRRRALPDDASRMEAEGWLGHARAQLAPDGDGRRQLAAAVAELTARLGAEHARTRALARLLDEPRGAPGTP